MLASCKYATEKVRNACGQLIEGEWVLGWLIVDSDITNPAITNLDVIDKFIEIRADFLVPKDFKNDVKKTYDSVTDFFNITKLKKYEGVSHHVIMPLQWPYDVCYDLIEPLKPDATYYALGGLVGLDQDEQLERIKVGVDLLHRKEKKCHVFGIYPKADILAFFKENIRKIESFDTNVMETNAFNGKMLDLEEQEFPASIKISPATVGKFSTPMRYTLAKYNLQMLDTIVNNLDAGVRNPNSRGGAPVYGKRQQKENENAFKKFLKEIKKR